MDSSYTAVAKQLKVSDVAVKKHIWGGRDPEFKKLYGRKNNRTQNKTK